MADDEDVIYVDVAARLDENAAEQATGKLRDKFKGIGKGIGSAITSDISRELGGALAPEIERIGKSWGHELTSGLGEAIGGSFGELAKNFGDSVVDFGFGELTSKLQSAKNSADGLKSAFADLKTGDTKKGIDGIADSLKDLGVNAKDLPGPLGQVADKAGTLREKFDGVKGGLKDFVETMGAVAALAPGWAGALEKVAVPLGEIAGSLGLVGPVEGWLKDLPGGVGGFFKDNLPDAGNALTAPFKDMLDYLRHPSHILTGPSDPAAPGNRARAAGPPAPSAPSSPAEGGNFLPSLPGAIAQAPGGMQTPSFAPPDTGGTVGTRSAFTGGGIHATLVDYTHPDAPDISSPSDIPGAAGGVANLFRVAESLQGTPYSQALRNDCSGMVSKLANAALGLPPVASFSTVNEGQWLGAHGFQQGMGGPGDLSIGWYDHGGGNAGHTAATLPGGVHAESGGTHGAFALGSGAAGADSPQFDHHMFLPMGAGGGGGGGFRAAPVGFGPPGLGGLGGGGMGPLPPPTQANQGGGSTQQQPLGHGQGVGVSGGGILGAAEQAGVMAAAIGGFGGGGIAAQMAEQEMNLAIQKGGQIAATMAAMPFETFGLTGGQMGAPTVQPMGGWPGKLIGGLIGQQTNLPNIAGGTQKPKQPDQKDGQQDPAGGNPPAGPSGSKDDPIHTRPADGAPQPGPGAMNSAANFTAMAGVTAL